jgi:chemotaxis protein MotB
MSGWDSDSEEEESSFISMTDMMVGLLLIFIILTTFFALQARNVIEAAARVSKVEQAAVVARGILFQRIQDQLDDDRIEFDAATGTIRFSDDVLRFETSSDVIPESSYEILELLADALAESVPCLAHIDTTGINQDLQPDCTWLEEDFLVQEYFDRDLGRLADYRPDSENGQPPLIWIDAVYIEGHTDCVPFGRREPDFGNWQLGASRASRTLLFLLDHNEALGRIFSKNPEQRGQARDAQRVFGVASYADRRPAHAIGSNMYPDDPRRSDDWQIECAAQDRSNQERNRRIDIRIVMGWTAQESA